MDMNNVNSNVNDVRYCPSCNAANKATSKFCMICGTKFTAQEPVAAAPAFVEAPAAGAAAPAFVEAPAAEPAAPAFVEAPAAAPAAPAFVEAPVAAPAAPAFGTTPATEQPAAEKKAAAAKPAVSKPVPEVEEPKPVFANGLPQWDIVPPDTMVRRKQA